MIWQIRKQGLNLLQTNYLCKKKLMQFTDIEKEFHRKMKTK